MVEVIHPGGRPVRAGRYLDYNGQMTEDVILDAAGVRPWISLDPAPERGFVDLGPLTLLPGLVDCHVHLALPPPRLGDDAAQTMVMRLSQCLEYGLVAVRDGGDRLGATLELQKRKELPRLVACGPALHPPGSYGTFLGPASGPEAMPGQVAELAEMGAGQIKVLVTGPVNLESLDSLDPPHFSAGNLHRLVLEAHRRGLKVMAHASGVPGVRLALSCGVDSLEHGYGMDEDTLALLRESGVTWVPTLAPMAALCDTGPENHRRAAAAALAAQMKTLGLAHSLGVNLAVGTDAGAPGVGHGRAYLRELRLLGEAGLPPAALVRAATLTGARLLDLPGNRAPAFIAVAGNPLEDLAALHQVRMVVVCKT
ncbi:MAG: amidohydrolase family protein [Peptococcaceae bacterium]|jgi:imidazolonepropionase-like amidohydrolase|nr:amidohydrolase family protein [Peptococcaceae bacterium]